jgi:hypothetical protein
MEKTTQNMLGAAVDPAADATPASSVDEQTKKTSAATLNLIFFHSPGGPSLPAMNFTYFITRL